MKKALRTVIERYELPVRLTANQNLILTAIDPSWKADILATLTAAGVKCVFCGAHSMLDWGSGRGPCAWSLLLVNLPST